MLGLPFSIFPTDIDENQITHTNPVKFTSELSYKKVERVIEVMSKSLPKWILGADTVIALDHKIFGKPADRDEAAAMIRQFSGRQHKVVTSMALYNGREKKIDCRSASCTVTFAALSEEEIEWFLDTNEWQGVAGAYRIQEKASLFITQIKGSPSNVAGLPLREFYAMLRSNGYPYGAKLTPETVNENPPA